MRTPQLFVFGLGFVGEHVARRACALGWRVAGSCRDSDRADALRSSSGIDAHTFDLDDEYTGLTAAGLAALAESTHVLATVPPIADLGRDPLLALHPDALVAAASTAGLRWAGYLSTTSVYGDHLGAWVDEGSETRAEGSRAAERLQAERDWLGLRDRTAGRLNSHVFRLSGIYGPGRSALDTVRRQLAERSAGRQEGPARYVSRVHIDDITEALIASMSAPAPDAQDATYNLSDDEPAARGEVLAFAAALLGIDETSGPNAEPSAEAAASTPIGEARARRRRKESKRVGNRKMRAKLLPQGLTYPTYREGLRAVLAIERGERKLH